MNSKLKRLVILVAAIVFITVSIFWFNLHRYRALSPDYTAISPDGQWGITGNYIGHGEPMVILIRIYDGQGVLRGETIRDIEPGGAEDFWSCNAGPCTGYRYGLGSQVETIILPPVGWVKFRAMIPG